MSKECFQLGGSLCEKSSAVEESEKLQSSESTAAAFDLVIFVREFSTVEESERLLFIESSACETSQRSILRFFVYIYQ